jgi:hypothetical protein
MIIALFECAAHGCPARSPSVDSSSGALARARLEAVAVGWRLTPQRAFCPKHAHLAIVELDQRAQVLSRLGAVHWFEDHWVHASTCVCRPDAADPRCDVGEALSRLARAAREDRLEPEHRRWI